jgi:hypothetical protein
VEVGIAKGGLPGGILKSLLAVDEFGFHDGVEIVLGDPVRDALGKWEVIEGIAEVGDGALDLMTSLMARVFRLRSGRTRRM